MDLETENQIASILMKEAAELRRQAEKEGVHAYLREPNVRFRPNSRFLTATVLGAQQANKVAEVNEMWRVRKREREVNNELPVSTRDKKKYNDSPRRKHNDSPGSSGAKYKGQNSHIPSSSKADVDTSCSSRDDGWKDEEIEQFLHSRVKRGRGGVGPRMDEPGPYLPCSGPDSRTKLSESPDIREREEWECRVLGPEKPRSFISNKSSEDDDDHGESPKKHSKKHRKTEDGPEKPRSFISNKSSEDDDDHGESPKKHSKKHRKTEDGRAIKERKERKSKHKHKHKHKRRH